MREESDGDDGTSDKVTFSWDLDVSLPSMGNRCSFYSMYNSSTRYCDVHRIESCNG